MNESVNKLLIVDDLEINRDVLRVILEENYEIHEAADGEQALEYLSDSNFFPEAILLDLMMPGIDGFETLEQIRKNEKLVNIPVLFITASDSDEDESRGILSGANDYITKPIKMDLFKAKLAKLNLFRM